MTTHQYRVYGYRYKHKDWPSWAMVEKLPDWLVRFREQEGKRADRFWNVQRMYYRLPGTR